MTSHFSFKRTLNQLNSLLDRVNSCLTPIFTETAKSIVLDIKKLNLQYIFDVIKDRLNSTKQLDCAYIIWWLNLDPDVRNIEHFKSQNYISSHSVLCMEAFDAQEDLEISISRIY